MILNIVGFMLLLMGSYVFFILENRKTELKLAFIKMVETQQKQNMSSETLMTYVKHTSVILFSATGLILIFNDFILTDSEIIRFIMYMFYIFVYFITFIFQLSVIIVYREGKSLKDKL